MTRSHVRLGGLVTAVLMLVGGLGTWASATVFGATISVNGSDRDGAIVIICAVMVAMAVVVASRAVTIIGIVAALAATATSVYDVQDVLSTTGVSVGWGLWLSAVASLVAAILTIARLREHRVSAPA